MNRAEAVAARVVRAIRPGISLTHNADQSHGEHDFDLVLEDGGSGIMEVTLATDERHRTLQGVLRGRSLGDAGECACSWMLLTSERKAIPEIRRSAGAILASLEAAGIEQFSSYTDVDIEEVRRLRDDLRVEFGSVISNDGTPRIFINSTGVGGMPRAEAVSKVIEVEASKADNLRKLSNQSAAERHLAVQIDWHAFEAYSGLIDHRPGPPPPNVDGCVTHVWAIARRRADEVYVVWTSQNGSPWHAENSVHIRDADIEQDLA